MRFVFFETISEYGRVQLELKSPPEREAWPLTGVNLLSFRVKQQEKMANYCKTIFGDALLTEPLDKYPVSPLLLRRICNHLA